ncbi:MAG TPA: ATP-binding protein [Lacunisphaera sp.]|nr:ATP-binding protein [Lacunisphaera sp.]
MSVVPAPAVGSEAPWPDKIAPEHEYRTLILAPTGNDARLTAGFLEAAGWVGAVVADMSALCEKIVEGCGAVLIAEEVMTNGRVGQLFGLLKRQPAWSDIPVALITTGGSGGGERARRLVALGANSNVTLLERPFRPATLVSTIEVALRSRRRQYQVRKLLRELSQARDVAERASNAKDDFLAALSHELRTPLNPVLLVATEAAADPTLPAVVRADFDQIARHVQLEARLIDDLLDLTRITRGKLNLYLQPVDGHAALRQALATTQADIDDKQLVVAHHLRATHSTIRADAVRLQQVLWNVLKNAAKFTPTGGRISLVTENRGDRLVIHITDTGVGMDAEELKRVFETFAQGNHARPNSRHRFGGLGLGLAISRMLMEQHGATISASSPGPGAGSTFSLDFPLMVAPDGDPALAAAQQPVPVPLGAPVRRLLLVEDHVATRQSLAQLLERRGYKVEAAGSLAQARDLADREHFDLVLSDIGLPDGTGYELMAALRDSPGIAGIALSGYGMETDLALSKEAGFIAHLTKPVSVQALDAALATAIAPLR